MICTHTSLVCGSPCNTGVRSFCADLHSWPPCSRNKSVLFVCLNVVFDALLPLVLKAKNLGLTIVHRRGCQRIGLEKMGGCQKTEPILSLFFLPLVVARPWIEGMRDEGRRLNELLVVDDLNVYMPGGRLHRNLQGGWEGTEDPVNISVALPGVSRVCEGGCKTFVVLALQVV